MQNFGLVSSEVQMEEYERSICPNLEEQISLSQYQQNAIFSVPIETIKQDLEKIDCVQSASVSRLLPSTIKVFAKIKKPIAIWQNERRFFFITEKGGLMRIRATEGVENFILVTGEDAPKHTPDLIQMFKSAPEAISSKVVSAMRISNRRWNVRFNNETELMLPEVDPELSWQKVCRFI